MLAVLSLRDRGQAQISAVIEEKEKKTQYFSHL